MINDTCKLAAEDGDYVLRVLSSALFFSKPTGRSWEALKSWQQPKSAMRRSAHVCLGWAYTRWLSRHMAATLQCKRSQLLVAATAEPICKLKCYLVYKLLMDMHSADGVASAVVAIRSGRDTARPVYDFMSIGKAVGTTLWFARF